MLNKKIWSAGFLAAVMLLGAGCGQNNGTEPGSAPGHNEPAPGGQTGQGAGGDNGAVQPEVQSESIKAYYTDPDLMELREGVAEISYETSEEKYKAAYEALQTSESEELIPLWEKIDLNSVALADGTLTLDVHIPAEANLGAGGEAFAIDALKNTFFQFEEVNAIQILIDGQQAESLMGHVTLEYPMTR